MGSRMRSAEEDDLCNVAAVAPHALTAKLPLQGDRERSLGYPISPLTWLCSFATLPSTLGFNKFSPTLTTGDNLAG